MMKELETLRDAYYGLSNAVKHHVEVDCSSPQPLLSKSYCAEHRAADFENEYAERKLAKNVSKSALTE